MYRVSRKWLVTAAALGAFGLARAPWEERWTAEWRQQRLLAPTIDLATREKLDQTAAAVAFGGLRTLIAAFANLRAYGYFEQQDWFRVEQAFETMVTLAPRTRYYWDTGSWHLAYNAAASYRDDESLPPVRRRQLWHDAISRGQAMLERGIRNNPDDWMLAHRLARLLDDPNKLRDSARAAEWFAYSAARGAPAFVSRNQVYALGRVPGREEEALQLARKLFADPANRVPSLNCLLFALEAHAGKDPQRLIREVFRDDRQAFDQLSVFLTRAPEGFVQNGVREALLALTRQLQADPASRTPLVNCLRFTLEAANGSDPVELSQRLFSSPREAFDQLSGFLSPPGRGYPQDGLLAALLPLSRELHADPGLRSPQLDGLRFALEVRAGGDPAALLEPIFGPPRQAVAQLQEYLRRAPAGWPRDGIETTLRRLGHEWRPADGKPDLAPE